MNDWLVHNSGELIAVLILGGILLVIFYLASVFVASVFVEKTTKEKQMKCSKKNTK